MSKQVTRQVATAIAKAAFEERDAFGSLPTYVVERHAEEAGVAVRDPGDATDCRSVTALAAYIRTHGQMVA